MRLQILMAIVINPHSMRAYPTVLRIASAKGAMNTALPPIAAPASGVIDGMVQAMFWMESKPNRTGDAIACPVAQCSVDSGL